MVLYWVGNVKSPLLSVGALREAGYEVALCQSTFQCRNAEAEPHFMTRPVFPGGGANVVQELVWYRSHRSVCGSRAQMYMVSAAAVARACKARLSVNVPATAVQSRTGNSPGGRSIHWMPTGVRLGAAFGLERCGHEGPPHTFRRSLRVEPGGDTCVGTVALAPTVRLREPVRKGRPPCVLAFRVWRWSRAGRAVLVLCRGVRGAVVAQGMGASACVGSAGSAGVCLGASGSAGIRLAGFASLCCLPATCRVPVVVVMGAVVRCAVSGSPMSGGGGAPQTDRAGRASGCFGFLCVGAGAAGPTVIPLAKITVCWSAFRIASGATARKNHARWLCRTSAEGRVYPWAVAHSETSSGVQWVEAPWVYQRGAWAAGTGTAAATNPNALCASM